MISDLRLMPGLAAIDVRRRAGRLSEITNLKSSI
jgi:hypothetical protein